MVCEDKRTNAAVSWKNAALPHNSVLCATIQRSALLTSSTSKSKQEGVI